MFCVEAMASIPWEPIPLHKQPQHTRKIMDNLYDTKKLPPFYSSIKKFHKEKILEKQQHLILIYLCHPENQ